MISGIIGAPIFWFTIGKLGNIFIPNGGIILTFAYLVIILRGLFYTRSEAAMKKVETRKRSKKDEEALFSIEKNSYSKFFGELVELEFSKDGFCQKKLGVQEQRTLSEIKKINDTLNHFFIELREGFSWIIPKRDLDNLDEIKSEFKKLGLEVEEHLDWE